MKGHPTYRVNPSLYIRFPRTPSTQVHPHTVAEREMYALNVLPRFRYIFAPAARTNEMPNKQPLKPAYSASHFGAAGAEVAHETCANARPSFRSAPTLRRHAEVRELAELRRGADDGVRAGRVHERGARAGRRRRRTCKSSTSHIL